MDDHGEPASAIKSAGRRSKICTAFESVTRIKEIFDAYRVEADRTGFACGPITATQPGPLSTYCGALIAAGSMRRARAMRPSMSGATSLTQTVLRQEGTSQSTRRLRPP